MREMRLFGSMSGNRKQSQAKPDCGDTRESRVISHRKTTAPAPVLDSTFFFANNIARIHFLVTEGAVRKYVWFLGSRQKPCGRNFYHTFLSHLTFRTTATLP